MLLKLLGKDMDSLSASEEAAVTRLATMQRRLVVESGRVNTKSEAGFNACASFLDVLASTARTLRLDAAPRSYRSVFTVNYRALFPDEARHYRVDVLEASVEQYAAIWVNGDKFEFSAEAMHRAEALQHAWTELSALLERWASRRPRSAARPLRSELRNTLLALDFAWASFEHKYISELIGIEEQARRLIVQAIEQAQSLKQLEVHHGKSEAMYRLPEYLDLQKRFVGSVAHLNSVANFRRKGRDDLRVGVLLDAVAALRRCDAAERDGEGTKTLSAARILATDVVDSFEALRDYLREVGHCLERVDPHLCNNAGLVERLVDWEESWEVGTRYVQHENLLNAVCDLVAEIQSAQRLVPALTAMCEECDAELFLVLPRIIWLRFLASPTQHSELLKSLLPHRFVESKDMPSLLPHRFVESKDNSSTKMDKVHSFSPELEQFIEKFRSAKQLVIRAQSPGVSGRLSADAVERDAWDVFMKRVVVGNGHKEDFIAGLQPALRHGARTAVEDLMNEVERWSMELQRHCPEDWNQCSAILVQCLTGGHQAQKKPAFRV